MSVPGPVLGPCESWIDGADVAAVCSGVGTDPSLLDTVAFEASMALYEVSGRQFKGLCGPVTVRPARDPRCGCWGSSSGGYGVWAWSWLPQYGGYGWWNEDAGTRIGCDPMSRVRLANYPVREIVEVKIDGVVLPPTDANGDPNYRLDNWRWLTRMDSPGSPDVKRFWPGCQNMSLDDTEVGTFSVSYRHGVDPPQLGRDAAAALACQLFKSASGEACALPTATTRVQRQGVTVDRGLLVNWFDPKKATGIVALDMFLAAYWRTRAIRRPAVWSPDVQPFARREGS